MSAAAPVPDTAPPPTSPDISPVSASSIADTTPASTPTSTSTATPSTLSPSDALDAYYAALEAQEKEGEEGRKGETSDDGMTAAAPTTVPVPSASAAPTAPITSSTTTPAPDPHASYWDEPVSDPDLPPSLQGKSRREVWDANKRSLQLANKAGLEKNDAVRRAEIAEAALKLLTETRTAAPETSSPAATSIPAPTAPPPAQSIFAKLGLSSPEEAYGAVPQIIEQLPALIQEQAALIAEDRLRPMAEKFQAMEQRDAENVRQAQWAAAETARLQAASHVASTLQIPNDTFAQITPMLANIMMAIQRNNPADPNHDPRRSESWVNALNVYRRDALRLIPQTTPNTIPAPPAGNAAPAASPSAAVPAARRPVSTGDGKLDAQIKDYLESFNKGNDKPITYERMVEKIREDRRGGRSGEDY